MTTGNQLKPAHVEQLVNAAAQNAHAAFRALETGPRFSDEQTQKLVDAICKDSMVAAWTLRGVPWLTESHKTPLRAVA